MYSRISGTRNGKAALKYAEGKAHNGNDERNILVEPINMLPATDYSEQMARQWCKARKNHTVQVRRIVISFSKNELDPMSEEDVELGNTIVKKFIETYYPDRQAVLYWQRDGKGGCLHCHAIVNDCDLTDAKGCTREQQHYKYVRKGIDHIAGQYIKLDHGKNAQVKRSQTERIKKERADIITAENPDVKGAELQQLLIENKAYSFMDDMRERIRTAITSSTNEDSFFEKLKEYGISVAKKFSKKYGDYYTYDFEECPISTKNTKSRSYKMGYSFSPDAIKSIWAEKSQAQSSFDTNEFIAWLKANNLSYSKYDEHGRLVSTDFDEMDRLHELYEQEKTNQTVQTAVIDTTEPDQATRKSNKQMQAFRHFARKATPLLDKLSDLNTEAQKSNQRVSQINEHINIDAPTRTHQKSL